MPLRYLKLLYNAPLLLCDATIALMSLELNGVHLSNLQSLHDGTLFFLPCTAYLDLFECEIFDLSFSEFALNFSTFELSPLLECVCTICFLSSPAFWFGIVFAWAELLFVNGVSLL